MLQNIVMNGYHYNMNAKGKLAKIHWQRPYKATIKGHGVRNSVTIL